MKRKLASGLPILAASFAVILGTSCTKKDGAAAVPKPTAPASKDVVAYIAIPSLDKAVKDVSAVAERFSPGQMTPETIKAQIGAMIGDPQLAGMEMQKPVVICVMKGTQPGEPPSFAAMLPAKQGAPYEQHLAALGMVTRFSGGVLLVSQTPEGLETASKAKGTYDQVAGAGLQKTARLHVQIAALMDTYGPLLDAQLEGLLGTITAAAGAAPGGQLPAGMGPEALQKILKLEIQGLLALLRQCDATEIDLDLGGQGIAIDEVLTAKPGSALAQGFTGSAGRPSPTASIVEGGGFMTGTFRYDVKSFTPLLKQILDPLSKEPGGLLTEGIVALIADMGSWWGGTATFSMRQGKEGAFTISYVMEILDEAKALATWEKSLTWVAPGTALGDMYKGMGVETKLEKAARQHAGVSINRLKISMAAPEKDANAPLAPDMAILKAWLKDMEVAFVQGNGLISNDPADLDRMIDQVRSSSKLEVALEAQKVFGAGAHGYMDYDIFGLMKSVLSTMPQGPGEDVLAKFDKVTSKAPTVFAVTFADSRARLQMRVPLEPFAQMKDSLK